MEDLVSREWWRVISGLVARGANLEIRWRTPVRQECCGANFRRGERAGRWREAAHRRRTGGPKGREGAPRLALPGTRRVMLRKTQTRTGAWTHFCHDWASLQWHHAQDGANHRDVAAWLRLHIRLVSPADLFRLACTSDWCVPESRSRAASRAKFASLTRAWGVS